MQTNLVFVSCFAFQPRVSSSLLQSQQTQNRMKLMADNYDDDHHHYHHHHHHHHHRGSPGRMQQHNHRPSPDQVSQSCVSSLYLHADPKCFLSSFHWVFCSCCYGFLSSCFHFRRILVQLLNNVSEGLLFKRTSRFIYLDSCCI